MTEKSQTSPEGHVPERTMNCVAASSAEIVRIIAEPAVAAAAAAGGAHMAKTAIKEIGATRRHRMTEETKRLEIQAHQGTESRS